jgi:hypothetical protein
MKKHKDNELCQGSTMKILNKTAVALIFGLLVGTASMPPRAALATDPVIITAEAARIKLATQSLFAVRGSAQLRASVSRQEESNCKPSHLYSSHDVVGDPQTCIMNRLDLSGGGVAP